MAKKRAAAKKGVSATIRLTPEQSKKLAEVFGSEFAKRIQDLKVEQIAGYLRAEMRLN